MRILCHEDRAVLLVADGLGGQTNGEIAARIATDTVGDQAGGCASWLPRDARAFFRQADQAVAGAQARLGNRMMTTLSALFLDGLDATLAHVGDTRIYWFREGQIYHQTEDHSVSQAAVRAGEITPAQIRFHEDRNRILCALGGSHGAEPECHADAARPGDAFLLCTDGFWELIVEEEMLADLREHSAAEPWLRAMQQRVLRRMGPQADNATAVAVIVQ